MSKYDHLHRTKAFKTTTGVGLPKNNEGSDGDMTIRAIGTGLFLFVKYGNFWYQISQLESFNPSNKGDKRKPIGTLPGTVEGNSQNTIGARAGSKIFLDGINSKNGITGENYIQSGNVNTSSSLGNNFSRDFINFTAGNRPILVLDYNGSSSRIIAGTDSYKSIIEGYKFVLSNAYGSTVGDTHISSNGDDELTITVGNQSMLHFVESTTNTMESQEIAEYLIRSGTTEDPVLHLKNTTNDATGPTLKLSNEKAGGGNVGADDDVLGTVSFDGEDDGGNAQQYGLIKGSIDVATDGQESGKVIIQVATHNGSLNDGITLTGGSTTGEVDTVLGKGLSSLTTISGDLLITGGAAKFKEQAAADSDTGSLGQLWVKNETPNCLAFTDDAGTDIVGIGKYHYETKICNFYSTSTLLTYLPIAGYVIERTSTAGQNEYISMIAPFNGTLEKFAFRSEIAQTGNIRFVVYESSDGTEVPGTLVFRKDHVSVSIADDTYTEFDLTSPSIGSYPIPITKGKIYAFAFLPADAPYDTNTTLVFKWDVTS